MTTLILMTPYLALGLGVAMLTRALHLYSVNRPHVAGTSPRKLFLLFVAALLLPTLAHAQGVDLRKGVESGNAIIMYVAGTFAAISLVTAGIAMGTGRQSIAKWAIGGAMICGIAFAIVHSMWSNMGMEASNVGTFAP